MVINYCLFERRNDKDLKFQINKSYLFEISTLLFKLLSYIKHRALKLQPLEENTVCNTNEQPPLCRFRATLFHNI